MATLTGNAIQSSYLGLVKTDDNAAIGATEKQLTDGAGNNVPMTVGTAGVTFTGDVAGINIPNVGNGSMQASLSGYTTATYWTSCTLTNARPSVSTPAIDQTGNKALLVPFNIDSRQTVTAIGIPMIVLGNDTLHVAIYEQASNGGPGVRVVSETASVTTANNNTWYELTLTTPWTPDQGKLYWIGAMSNAGGAAGCGLGYVSGEADNWQRFTTTNNSTVGTVIAINTLYNVTAGTMPTDYSSTTFQHRDERLFLAWK